MLIVIMVEEKFLMELRLKVKVVYHHFTVRMEQ